MAEETESIATLLARREYVRAVPLLKKDLDKYPTNVRIRLQYADALAGLRLAVQLRSSSNGEMSAAIADLLAAGTPVLT